MRVANIEPGIIIWDVDGVLIDVRDSYRRTIVKTVQNYFSNFIGLGLKDELMKIEDTQKFKLASGFNDDWELAYAAVLCYLAVLVDGIDKKKLRKWNSDEKPEKIEQMVLRLHELGKLCGNNNPEVDISELTDRIGKNGGGLDGTEKTLSYILGENLNIAKKFWFPELIKRVFEEIYLGIDLFEKKYGEPARFVHNEGLIRNERAMVELKTLIEIRRRYYFGIATGRERFETEFSLNENRIGRIFDKRTIVCSDDVKKKKPDPAPLIECRNRVLRRYGLGKNSPVIYVGDSIDDLKAARNANFYFAGVLGAIPNPDERNKLREKLHDMHSDIIVDDILELTIYI
ncbi:MAG TPA: HAD family hydrolase [Candidatus Altiarchaeales archaeon]|nr:HAD family hydrolase [Candidatus Altiarchaeales archaeon]